MSEWFTSLTNQAQQYAEQAKKQIDDLADNIATQVETAQNEIDEERMKLAAEQGLTRFPRMNAQSLPWETDDEDRSILTQALMEKTLSVSFTGGGGIYSKITLLSSIDLTEFWTSSPSIPLFLRRNCILW